MNIYCLEIFAHSKFLIGSVTPVAFCYLLVAYTMGSFESKFTFTAISASHANPPKVPNFSVSTLNSVF